MNAASATAASVASRFFVHSVVLLVLYALVSLIAALKFLPGDFTQTSLPYSQVGAFAAALLDLVVLGGLLGGGIYAMGKSVRIRSLNIVVLLWSLLALLTVVAGILNLLVSLAPLFAVLKIAVIVLVIGSIASDFRAPIPLVWTLGMSLTVIAAAITIIPTSDFFLASALHALAFGISTYIGYVLAAVALTFWLMRRFSNVTPLWADMSLYTVAGLLALAGALTTLSTLNLDSPIPGGVSAVLIPLLYLIFASHSYRALSDRNATNTLAAHWTALGVLLLLLGGVLGGLQAPVRLWTAGTRLSDLQPTLALLAVVVIILGVVNQAAAEMRGDNRRVTGLAPFWLVAFGVIGGGLALAGAGLVQVYLERILSIGYLDTQALLEPLHALWVGGQGLFALGVGWYTLVFWLRRPRL